MTVAQVVVEVGFTVGASTGTYLQLDDTARGLIGSGTLAPDAVWTDVTPFVSQWSARRGSSRVDGPVLRYDPGTLQVTLDNSDRRFDPTNIAGPYVSAGVTQVTPRRAVRVSGVWAGVTYPIFRGFVDSWQVAWDPGPAQTSTVTLQATDGTKILAAYNGAALGSPVGAGETSGARVNRILDSAVWPATDRVVATGDSTLAGTTLAAAAYTDLLLTVDSELGELYVDAAGRVVFRNRQAILTESRSTTPAVTLRDDNDFTIRTNLVTNPSMEAASGTVVTRTNLIVNPILGVDLSTWITYPGPGGTASAVRQAGQAGWALVVSTSIRQTWSVATTIVDGGLLVDTPSGTIIPTRIYGAVAQVRASKAQRVVCYIQWLTAAGAGIVNSASGAPVVLTANTAATVTVSGLVAPANAAAARLVVASVAGTSGTVWNVGDWLEATTAHVEETNLAMDASAGGGALQGAFWGAIGAGSYGPDYTYTWAGAAHASASEQRAPAVVGHLQIGSSANTFNQSTDRAWVGSKSARVVWATGGVNTQGMQYIASGLTIGKTYTHSLWAYVPTASPPVQLLSNATGLGNGTGSMATKDQWVRMTQSYTATATTHTFYIIADAAAVRGSALCYVDGVQLEVGSVASPYFDGSTSTAYWNGTPDASTSTLPTAVPYENLTIAYDDTQIVNLALIGRVGGTQQQASDTASQQTYLRRTQNRTDLLMQTDAEALDYAGFLVYQGKDPELRFDQVDLWPATFDGLWPHALGRDFGDRITIVRNPPGGGTITRDCFIRGVSHQGSADDWRTSWTLQSASRYQFFTLDHPTLGVLDSNALAY